VGTYPVAGSHAAVSWSLTHDNAFKRVVMSYFFGCGSITFFGASVALPETIQLPAIPPPITPSTSSPKA
jgi:hypothetical protein